MQHVHIGQAPPAQTPTKLTDADCIAQRGWGHFAVHQQCALSWSADGQTPTYGPCDYCASTAMRQYVADAEIYIPTAVVVGAIAHIGFGLALGPSVAVGLIVPLAVNWLFTITFGGTM